MSESAYLVPILDVPKYWTFCRDGIKSALERNCVGSIERVEWAVQMGMARLWMVFAYDGPLTEQNLCVGYGVTFCEGGYCNVWAYAGDLKRFHLYPQLARHARDERCHTIRLVGPRAWQRVLGPEWKVTAYVIERPL